MFLIRTAGTDVLFLQLSYMPIFVKHDSDIIAVDFGFDKARKVFLVNDIAEIIGFGICSALPFFMPSQVVIKPHIFLNTLNQNI